MGMSSWLISCGFGSLIRVSAPLFKSFVMKRYLTYILDTLVTFFPKRESDPIEGPLYQQADLRDSIFNEVNVDLTRQCENALDLAALSALHAVSVLLDRASHPDLEIFRIFEEAISVLVSLTALLTYNNHSCGC